MSIIASSLADRLALSTLSAPRCVLGREKGGVLGVRVGVRGGGCFRLLRRELFNITAVYGATCII